MTEWLSSIGPGVGNHLWQTTAFAAVVWAVTLLLRRNQARVRYGLWLAASVKFLVPFSLLIGLGGLLPRPQRAMVAMPVYSAVDTAALPFAEMPVENPTHAAMRPRHEWGTQLPGLVAGVWLCGAMVVLLVWMSRWRQVARTLRQAVRAEDGREAELLRRVEARMVGRVRIPLLLSREMMEPGIFGIGRPVLIWPERLSERLDDEHIEAILAHELMHVRRRDNLTAALHMFVEAAFWFHPMVWWMGRRMVEERERACDEAVVEMGSRPGVYAESLLKAVRFCVESPLACVAGITGADLTRRVRSIMTLRLERMSLGKKVALGLLGFAAIAGPVGFGIVRMIPLYGQILHATGPLPSFEVASIRPMEPTTRVAPPPGGAAPNAGRVAPNGEQIISRQEVRISSVGNAPQISDHVNRTMTTKMLIDDAYNLPAFSKAQIVGGPDWTDQTMYQIQAKIDDTEYTAMQKMPAAQQVQQVRLMEQSLLAERYKLKVHFETRELPVYALEMAKGGPKLKSAKTDSAPAGNAAGPTQVRAMGARILVAGTGLMVVSKGDGAEITAKGASPGQLILLLQQQPEVGNRMVVDKTGLTGHYDFSLNWTREGADAGTLPADAGPSFFTALKEELGLQLVESKAPVEVIVIDSIEKPSVDGAEVSAPTAPSSAATTPAPAIAAAPATSAVPVRIAYEKQAGAGTQATLKSPEFEVASVRQAAPEDPQAGSSGHKAATTGAGSVSITSDRASYRDITLKSLLMRAYDLEPFQISGPAWIESERYDVLANIPEGTPKEDVPVMLQHLLAERFGMTLHSETKEHSGYILGIGKGGPKLKLSEERRKSAPAASVTFENGSMVENLYGETMPAFAVFLSRTLGRPVMDSTGLSGKFDIVMTVSEGMMLHGAQETGADGSPVESDSSFASLFTAIHDLGLKLDSDKVPLKCIVVDKAQKIPTEN